MSKKTYYAHKSFRDREKVTYRIGDVVDATDMDEKQLKFYLHYKMVGEEKPAVPNQTKPVGPKVTKAKSKSKAKAKAS